MSAGEYYGRVDYACQRPDDKNSLLASIVELLGMVFSKIFKKRDKYLQ